MVVKTVIKSLFSLIVMLCFSNNAIGQSSASKYLLFDSAKDSLIMLDNTHYYKIDNTLFDLDRYNQIDSLNYQDVCKLKIISVEKLLLASRARIDSITERESVLKTGIIYISDTNNDFFPFIYVLEKLQDCKYKRTRVWWIDY